MGAGPAWKKDKGVQLRLCGDSRVLLLMAALTCGLRPVSTKSDTGPKRLETASFRSDQNSRQLEPGSRSPGWASCWPQVIIISALWLRILYWPIIGVTAPSGMPVRVS